MCSNIRAISEQRTTQLCLQDKLQEFVVRIISPTKRCIIQHHLYKHAPINVRNFFTKKLSSLTGMSTVVRFKIKIAFWTEIIWL